MDMFDALTLGNRTPSIIAGDHLLLLAELSFQPTRKAGQLLAARFVVAESTSLSPGTVVEKAFFVNGENAQSEWARVGTMVAAMTGQTDVDAVRDQCRAMVGPAQSGRGMAVRCSATAKVSKNGKAYTDCVFFHYDQTPEQIGQFRGIVDQYAPQAQAQAAAPVAQAAAKPGLLGMLK